MKYMKEEGSITPLDAIREFGITRLSARIWELKHNEGVRIKSATEVSKNKYGKSVNYSRYSLVQD